MGLLYGALCYYKLNGWLLSHWATVFTQCKFSFLKSENKKNKYKTSANYYDNNNKLSGIKKYLVKYKGTGWGHGNRELRSIN